MAGPALANPAGGTVAAGSAAITTSSPTTVTVVQQSERAIINWQSFSIGAGETTQFIQPNSGAFVLNRVLGGDPSLIAGHLIANGGVAIVNGAGILFLNGSVVDVNSLVATPADITNANFMAGRLIFDIPSANQAATVVNEGHISVKDHGLAALVAPGVANSGVIEAKLGKVVLGGAETFTVDLYGDGLINFAVGSAPAAAALVSNTGRISADGGTILLSADTADAIVSNVVTGGTLEARSVGAKTGTVAIEGGAAEVSGRIDVSGAKPGETGGTVEVTGTSVAVASGATIDASGAAGGGTVLIGGGFHGAGPLPNAATTTVAAGAAITADATTSGNGGNVAVWSNGTTVFDGSISAQGGAAGGNGGYVETSGSSIVLAGSVDTRAGAGTAGTWLIDPDNLLIGSTVAATINAAATNVAVQASGDITVASDLAPMAGVSLGLDAGGNIALNANVNFATNSDSAGNLFLTAGGAITQGAGATITMAGGTASLSAGTGIGTGSAPIATAGLGTMAARTTAGGIFLANGTSGDVIVGAPSGLVFTAGTSPTTTPATDDAAATIQESTGTGADGANALVITTNDLSNTAVTFGALSGISGAGDISLANAAGDITIDQSVDTGGSITLSASGNLDLEAAVGATATGAITLAADSSAAGTGLLTVNGAVGSSGAGAVTLSGATIAISAAVEGGGSLTLAPSTAASGIALGDGATGSFALSSASLGNLGSGGGIGSGFAAITIGRPDGTGAIDVDNGATGTLAFASPLTLESPGAGGTITVATALGGSAGLSLQAGGAAATTAISIGADVTATDDAGLVASAGDIALTGNVTGANVLLSATNGAVTETGGAIGAGDLIVLAKHATALNTASNSVAVLAADVTGPGAGLAFTNAGGFAAGAASVSPPGLGTLTQDGVSANGDVGLVASAGTVTLEQNVSGANVLLSALSGAVTESGGAVTATDLIVLAQTDSVLNASNSASVLAADVTGGGLAFTNVGGFAVDAASVSPPGIASATQSGISATGDVGLVASAGTLTLNQNVSGTNVLLSAISGAVTESSGAVSTTDLIVLAQTDSVLNASNSASVLAADVTGGGLAFTDASGFAVNGASVNPAHTGAITQSGISATGDVGLVASAGTLTLTQNVSGANVLLSAATGAVTENGGAVSATDLIVLAQTDSALASSGNSVGVLAANVTGGGLAFTNGGSFAVNQASVNPANTGAITQSNVTATGDLGLVASAGTLTLDQNVTGANVLLSATAGAVTESGGAVGATDLIVKAANATALNTATNSASVLAANVTSGGFAFTNAGAFTAGAASVNPADLGAITLNGVAASGDSALVASSGSIAIAKGVSVGSFDLLLHAAGAVSESGTGAVTAGGLLLRAGSIVDLPNANQVGIVAARYGTALAFADGTALAVGSVSVSAPGISDASNNAGVGDGTGGGDVALVVTSGSLTLSDAVDVGAHNLLLASDTSTVGGAGAITANGLVLVMTGDETVSGSYAEIGASIASGGFSYTGSSSYQAGVSVNSPSLGGTFGVTATGDVGLVATTGTLTLAQNVSGANVLLDAPAGAVTETSGGVIAHSGTGGLVVVAENDSALNATANSVGVLAASVTGGGFAFTNAGSFTVNEASVSPPSLGTVTQNNVDASGDAGLVSSAGSITLAENVAAANVLLSAPLGGVNETTGHVAANSGAGDLIVLAETDSALDAANSIGIFGANVSVGGLAFTNSAGFTVGAAAVNPANTGAITRSGATAGADIGLVASADDLTLAKNVTGADALLSATSGAVTETAGAVIAGSGAGSLIVEALNDTALASASNSVGVIAANVSGGSFSFTNVGGFAIGSVTLSIPATVVAGASSVAASLSGIDVSTNLTLTARTGSISQTRALTVAGTSGVATDGADGSITLTNTGNDLAGAVTLDTLGASSDASLTNDAAGGTSLTAATVTGNLTVIASAGGIAETGTIASGGNLALKASAGSIAIDETLQSSHGNLFLEADGGGSTVTLAGGVLALGGTGSVSIVANAGIGGSGAGQFIPLTDSGGVLTLSASAATGGIYVAATDASGATLGAQATPPTGFTSIAGGGVAAPNGDVAIENTNGSLAVAAKVSSTAGSIYLEADGSGAAITSSGGAIDLAGGALSLVANAGVGSTSAPVAVVDASALTIAGTTLTGGWYVSASSPNAAGAAVTIGSATPPASFATTPVTGITVTSSGDVGVRNAGGTATGGGIVLSDNISASGSVFLEADGTGAAITTIGGTITLGGPDLSLVANAGVGTAATPLEAVNGGAFTLGGATATGGFSLLVMSPDAAGAAVTIGVVTPPSFFATTPLTGLTVTTSGNVAIENAGGTATGGSITLGNSIIDNPGNVFLEADGPGSVIAGLGSHAIELAGGDLSLVADAGIGSASEPVRIVDASPLTIAGTSATGGIYILDSASSPSAAGGVLTVGAVTPPAWFETTSLSGLTVTTGGDVALRNAGGSAGGGSIVLTDDILLAAGNVFLEADQSSSTIATNGGLIFLAGNDVGLVAGSGVGTASAPIPVLGGAALTLAGAAGSGGWYVRTASFEASETVTIGAVTPPAFFPTTPLTGITDSSAGDIALLSAGGFLGGGSIVLANAITASGNVFLDASQLGAQIVSSGGVITLANGGLSLVADAGIGAATAPIEIVDGGALTLAGTTATGGFYVSASSPVAAGGSVTIGALTPPAFFLSAPISGVTVATSGDVALRNAGGTASGGSIVVADDVAAPGNVFFEADKLGATIAASGGAIDLSGGSLSLVAQGGVGTASAPVEVIDGDALTLAGAAATGGWYVSASSAAAAGAAVTIGTVAPPAFFGTTPVSGVTVATSGDVALQNAGGTATGGSIVLANDASAAGNLFLEATGAGSTIASSGGTIGLAGGSLSLFATAGIGTSASGITVSDTSALTLAAETATGGVYLSASDPVRVTVGHAAAAPSFFANGASGLESLASSTSGDVALQNTSGSISLATSIDLASAGSVYLEADGAGARITASGGTIDLAGGGLSLVAGAGVGTASAPVRVVDGSALTIAGATGTGGWYVSVSSPNAAGTAVTVGALTPPAFFATTSVNGVTVVTGGDAALQNLGGTASGGSIVLTDNIDLSSDAGGNAFLEADGSAAAIAASGGSILLDGTNLALIAQGGIGTSAAPIVTSDAGPLTVAASTLAGGVFLSDASPVAAGAAVTVGQVATPGFFATPLVTGIASPNGGNVTLANAGGSSTGGAIVLADSLTLASATGTLTLAATGPISQTGGAITANLLSLSAGGSASLAMNNAIASLGTVTISATGDGDFVFQDAGNLALVGNASVANGSIDIATTGIMTVAGGLAFTSTGHVGLGSAGFNEAGSFTIGGAPAVIVDATGLTAVQLDGITVTSSSQASSLPLGPGVGGGPVISFGGFDAAGSTLLISVDNGSVTGNVMVAGLGISGSGDTIDLFGSIAGVSNEFAAILAVRAQGPDNDDRFNSCAIGSPACVVEPILIPVIPPSLDNVDFLTLPAPLDPLDIDRLNTGNEDDL